MSVTFPQGFRAAGVAAGLKASGAKDVALVVNYAEPAQRVAVARFTSNRFQAAPVVYSRGLLQRSIEGDARTPSAVVLNSGGANACTGKAGLADAAATAAQCETALGLGEGEVLVCSTGLIGERLDLPKLQAGVDQAAIVLSGGQPDSLDAATAIMTTDTVPKQAQWEGAYRIGGMAKGAGMLAPGLATMLVVVTTDAVISPAQADQALAQACRYSFDRADSDGCMSTNDSVILLGSGASGQEADPAQFTAALTQVCQDLAQQLIHDAEGASHDIAVTVSGALTEDGAVAVARAIARSNLFKTAMAGNDPNWGRVLAAAGTVPEEICPFQPHEVDVLINGVAVCQGGGVGQPRELVDLAQRQVDVEVKLGAGEAQATIWTNDLTREYVHINADYSS